MDKITIEGIEAYDGSYDLDPGYFTNRELHTIKRLSGVRAGELPEALGAGDSDLMVALAAIALQRAGKFLDEDLLWDAEAGKITYEVDDEAADTLPPPRLSGDDSSSGAAETNATSGENGPNGSVNSPTIQPVTGPGSWEPSVTSGQAT